LHYYLILLIILYINIGDVGDPSFGTYDLFMPKGSIYINPAIYLSLGFGVPGALGVIIF